MESNQQRFGQFRLKSEHDKVAHLRAQGFSIRQIAAKLRIGVGTTARTLQAVPKVEKDERNARGPVAVSK